ncbi:uncharacterized protein LOC114162163 isoform X2 [Vigna unguiculata]|uniref:uncharacterized protein LOC114162163 isoform X2 n=1 Tax=Vigna unguiculata TaxID=3917 RepID=UPI0010166ACD|nr:uncharacterized protein LOC114162163 isoform X2 [Vigna unguiculata]
MAEEFSKSVEEGLHLSKRIYFGKDRAVSPPKPAPSMSKSNTAFLPTAPMLYAVIHNPAIVDNPDVPSYQPYVHGKCDPPALIPLHMTAVHLQAECHLDAAAFLTLSATFRLHCVSGSRFCDCIVAVPVPHQGSILGVEVSVHRKSYSTLLVDMKDKNGKENMIQCQDGGFIGPNLFTLQIPQIDGGSKLSVKFSWYQKILYSNDEFFLNVPFTFPDFVNPVGKMSKKEKVEITVNAIAGSELLCQKSSHPMKKVSDNAGSTGFLYEADVLSWSKTDFSFSYVMPESSSHISGGVLLESAPVDDFDQRDMFCMYIHPGNLQSKKAIEMLSDAQSSVPIIFLVTDGTVEDEREICDVIKNHVTNGESMSPRIYTVGIGPFCNHYFLRMLATISRGQHLEALDADLIESQMLQFFHKASSIVLANITPDIFNGLNEVEVCPFHIPDLSSDGPLILSGRFNGSFPKDLEIKGLLADFSNFVIDMKIEEANDIPVQRICARDQIEYLTAQAWLSKDENLEQRVAKLSLQTGFISEYTLMANLENDLRKNAKESDRKKEVSKKSHHKKTGAKEQGNRMFLLPHLGIGFGNLAATAENIQPGRHEPKGPDAAEIFVKRATNCCSTFCNSCCCMVCIQACSRMNNQCANAITQLCVGLGCLGCLDCCADICCSGNEN